MTWILLFHRSVRCRPEVGEYLRWGRRIHHALREEDADHPYGWPGNARQLISTIERLAARAGSRIITTDHERREVDLGRKWASGHANGERHLLPVAASAAYLARVSWINSFKHSPGAFSLGLPWGSSRNSRYSSSAGSKHRAGSNNVFRTN